MLRHLVTWRLAADTDRQRREDADTIVGELRGLVALIPEIRALTVAPNAAAVEGNWDLALVIDFDDEAGLRTYLPHPEHQRVVGIIRPLVRDRAAIDLTV